MRRRVGARTSAIGIGIGHYRAPLSLETAFFILLLAPEFYWPLRELGIHYHARAEAMDMAGGSTPVQGGELVVRIDVTGVYDVAQ